MRKYPKFRIIACVTWIIVAIGGISWFSWYFSQFHTKREFFPYSAKVISVSTDKTKHGGINYQNIVLDNKKRVIANGFSSEIQGKKTRLIDYIAIGDSVVCDSTDDVLYVYRAEAETYRFTYNPSDFK